MLICGIIELSLILERTDNMKRLSFLATNPFPNYRKLISIMSTGKPAAIGLLLDEYKSVGIFDFTSELVILDHFGIYGSTIVKLYYDVAGGRDEFHSLLKKLQLNPENIIDIKRKLYGPTR